jgi:glutathione S-transferase
MITLHTFGSMWGIPDPSPFVIKADLLLKMSKVPYVAKASGLRGAPKGKLPYIEDDGLKIGDSTFIRLHLEKKYGIDFDKGLSLAEKGIAWSVEKALEDNLYWAIVHERWMVDENFAIGPKNFFAFAPALIRPLIVSMVRRKVRGNLHGHGLGRHSRDEVAMLANRVTDSLAAILGDKPYLMGANKCGADATAFAFTVSTLCPRFATLIRTHAERHRNLVAYCDRMAKEFYPDIGSNQRAAA